MSKFLIIQTAFIGDAILATAVLEKLHAHYPDSTIDLLVRKGNDSLFTEHPFLNRLLIWDKKSSKLKNLFSIRKTIRKEKYDSIINLHRFASSGLLVYGSGATNRIGFDKNPFSFCYTKKVTHEIGNGKHETERNQQLIEELTDATPSKPKLYPTNSDKNTIQQYIAEPFICIAPASVWFTKQFPEHKWVELIQSFPSEQTIYLLGAPSDVALCESIISKVPTKKIFNLASQLSLLASAALMEKATMSYVNDSAPMHLCSAMNANVTAVYCSTIPEFGFGPLSENSTILQTPKQLDCRPCGLHGFKKCPKGHFDCAESVEV